MTDPRLIPTITIKRRLSELKHYLAVGSVIDPTDTIAWSEVLDTYNVLLAELVERGETL